MDTCPAAPAPDLSRLGTLAGSVGRGTGVILMLGEEESLRVAAAAAADAEGEEIKPDFDDGCMVIPDGRADDVM